MDSDLELFMTVTGVDSEKIARGYLEIAGYDVGRAIQTYYDDPDLRSSFSSAPSAPAASFDEPSTSTFTLNRNVIGREDSSGVIHLDSDDDIDIPDDRDDQDIEAIARNVQEEEDAAMARRLQEELFEPNSGSGTDNDGVRAPIAQTTEVLAGPELSWNPMGDHEPSMYDPSSAYSSRPRRNRNPPNPFNQSTSIWDDTSAPPVSVRGFHQDATPRAALLRDLFRPPHEFMSDATWDEARDEGKENKKWIMVNLQDLDIFQCQVLNRDLWKDHNIMALIREHFIFLQYDKNERRAQSYIQLYFTNGAHENSDNYPHVSIIDPRTGEQVKVWSGPSFPKAEEFLADLIEFLDRYSLAANSKNPVVQTKPKRQQIDVGRLTEDEMLQLAMQNSLENNGASSGSSVQDPDMLTKLNDDNGKGKGKGRATNEIVDSDDSTPTPFGDSDDPAVLAFHLISSTNRHTEPENDPAATTRIQFRHSAGRIIRRFSTTDPVRRIYEWLKAEPFEGKEGVMFELKAMPAGADLIDKLDTTIVDAGLKQGTVMIEFIEG
ncbi:hypothetical protein GGS21DRAFT_515349 [Xylaria nigripes]|nr:hypothetical protein GGS21DRAFT_515349 [Xylaria nigripes]